MSVDYNLKNYEVTCPKCKNIRMVSYYIYRRISRDESNGMCRICAHVGNTGKKHSTKTRSKMSKSQKGRTHSSETRMRMSLNQMGDKNSCWRGGFSGIGELIRSCTKYKEWREGVFSRDNWECVECCSRGVSLEAHHKIKFLDIIKKYNIKNIDEAHRNKELWDIGNGDTLCMDCHKDIHRKVLIL